MLYNFNNIILTNTELASQLGIGRNKLINYLIWNEVLDLYGNPCSDYEDWFVLRIGRANKRVYDISMKGVIVIENRLKQSGLEVVDEAHKKVVAFHKAWKKHRAKLDEIEEKYGDSSWQYEQEMKNSPDLHQDN